jgi:hypothetical protein
MALTPTSTTQPKKSAAKTKGRKKLVSKASKASKSTKATKVKVPKATKVEVVDGVKVDEVVKAVKVEEVVRARKFNNKPVLAKTTGINISPAKVKNVVSNYVLNRDSYAALVELKNAKARSVTVDGVVTTEFAGTPIAQLSESTQAYAVFARNELENVHKVEYARLKVTAFDKVTKARYSTAKTVAKTASHANPLFDEPFDLVAFNTSFDAKFYSAYKSPVTSANEWDAPISAVTKLKNRFSTNSRVFLSAFVECLIKQLALNGTVSCVVGGKKIIQLQHVLDTTTEGFAERFPLHSMVTSLNVYKQAQSYVADPEAYVAGLSGDVAGLSGDVADKPVKKSKNRVTDLFTVEGIDIEKQHQFRYYISESCREIRMDLSQMQDTEGKTQDTYNYTSVSKIFKNFCSSLVCEFLMRIGLMLQKEIETRCIKTVNDVVIKTVISQYHIVHGIDETNTFKFIKDATDKYYKYLAERQSARDAESTEPTGDLEYTDE